jgi:predicted dehydrogenase
VSFSLSDGLAAWYRFNPRNHSDTILAPNLGPGAWSRWRPFGIRTMSNLTPPARPIVAGAEPGRRDPLRVGIIGIGYGQNVLLPAFRADDRVVVTALAASSVERAQAVASRAGVDGYFGDWRSLIASPAVDAVAIAVPPKIQPEIASAAIRAGKAVFCEKPLAVELADGHRLLEQARTTGVTHAVDFEFRELASWRRAKELLEQGALGELRGFTLTWHVETRANRLRTESWKQRQDLGGGALFSFASHSLHLIEWLLGRVVRMKAHLSPGEPAVDTRVTAILELAGERSGTISIATDAVGGWGHRLEIHGAEGALLLENSSSDHLRNFVLTRASRTERATEVDERVADASDQGDGRIAPVARLVRRFVDAALGGPATAPGLIEGVRVQELIEAVRGSARSGGWVAV